MITPGSFGLYEGGVGDQRFSQRNRGDREAAPEVQHQFCGQQGNGPAGVFAESTEHYTDPAAGLDDIWCKTGLLAGLDQVCMQGRRAVVGDEWGVLQLLQMDGRTLCKGRS